MMELTPTLDFLRREPVLARSHEERAKTIVTLTAREIDDIDGLHDEHEYHGFKDFFTNYKFFYN